MIVTASRVLRVATLAALLMAISVSMAVAAEPASWRERDAATAADPAETRFYMLSFTDEPIGEVTEAVLGSALNRPFTIAEDVDGVMSFRVEQSLDERGLLARFSEALAVEGVALIERDGRLALSVAPPAAASAPAASLPAPAAPAVEPTLVEERPVDRRLAWPGLAMALGGALLLGGLAWAFSAHRRGQGERPTEPSARQATLDRLLREHPVPPDLLAAAHADAARRDVPVERELARAGAWSYDQLAQAYAAASGCALWRPAERPPIAIPTDAGLAATLTKLRLVAVAGKGRLAVATDDPLDEARLLTFAAAVGRPVEVLTGAVGDVAAALQRAAVASFSPPHDDGEAGARLLAGVLDRRPA